MNGHAAFHSAFASSVQSMSSFMFSSFPLRLGDAPDTLDVAVVTHSTQDADNKGDDDNKPVQANPVSVKVPIK